MGIESEQNLQEVIVKVLTSNAAGGKPKSERKPDDLGRFIREEVIDFVFLQELAELEWVDGNTEDVLAEISSQAGENYTGVFSPTVDTISHPCPMYVPDARGKKGKWYDKRFVPETGASLKYAAQGNGFLINGDKWRIVDLWGGA